MYTPVIQEAIERLRIVVGAAEQEQWTREGSGEAIINLHDLLAFLTIHDKLTASLARCVQAMETYAEYTSKINAVNFSSNLWEPGGAVLSEANALLKELGQ